MIPEVVFGEYFKQNMEASTSKEGGNFAQELEDELMKFTANYEEKTIGARFVDQTKKLHESTDMKGNSMECPKSGGNEAQHSDTTECSSSFDGSDCGAADASSCFQDDAESDLNFGGCGKLFRRKVSSHWRSFVHPIMWRCKWLELQIKKLDAQAKKYDREIQEFRTPSLEGDQNHGRSEVLRRKKRTRVEATNDIATYLSNHNLFSYYENRKSITKAARHMLKNPDATQGGYNADDECCDNDECCIEAGIDDNYLEDVWRKIEHLQSRVTVMKARVGKVTRGQDWNFSCTDRTVVRKAHISSPSPQKPIGKYIASQVMSDYNLGGVLLPAESAITDNGQAVPVANGCSDCARNPYGYEDDEILIDNQIVRGEVRYFDQLSPEISSVTNVGNDRRRRARNQFVSLN